MVNICAIATIGLPGAGKTTFCRHINKFSSEYKVIHICYDEIFNFHPESNEITFKKERRKVTQQLKQIIDEIKSNTLLDREDSRSSPSLSYVLLLDDNNYYAGMRYEIYKICKANQVSFGQVYFPVDLQCALARNATRGQYTLPSHVIEKMNSRLQKPSDKNQWERNTLVIDNCEEFEKVWSFLKICFLNTVKSTHEKIQQTTEVNFIHELDICLRKRIKELLKTSEENLSEKANILNKRRKSILLDIKNRNVFNETLNKHIICEQLTLS